MKLLSKYKTILLVITLIFFTGCPAAPNKSKIEETIIKHFEAKGYKVIDLKIGDINPIPISKKTYMGTPGYMIDVPSLTLQQGNANENIGNSRMGEKVTFSNAHILIRQRSGTDKRWLITDISGINVP